MTYAIIQEVDGKLVVAKQLYSDFESAKAQYLDVMQIYYKECFQIVNGASVFCKRPNAPKFVKFGEMTILGAENEDQLKEIKQTYENSLIETRKNGDEQYNKAVQIRKNLNNKMHETILSNIISM
jgi:hypothetical protein